MKYQLLNLKNFGDNHGRLVVCQDGQNCPFEVKRAFWIFDTKPNIVRGSHANRNSEFMLIAINGSCKVKIDDGKTQEVVCLNNPLTALYIDKMIWKEMYDFSYNATLLVLTNTLYDENEYIRNYDQWKVEINDDK